jgi:CP family cyanate transporter-like MFS transporter
VSRSKASRPATPWLVVGAVLVVALSFRAPFLAVGPITEGLGESLALGAAELGLLTAIPVLCFGLSAPLAAGLARRTGFDVALLVALATITAGLLVRSAGPWASVLVGSVVIGLGITIGNIVVPAIIRRDVGESRRALATSGYTGAMNVGAMAATLSVAPLTAWLGWRSALASWALVTLTAFAVWGRVVVQRRSEAVSDPAVVVPSAAAAYRPVRYTALGWLLALAFAGQVSAYYCIATWLPQLLADETGLTGAQAGAVTSWFQVLAVPGALLLSLALQRVPWTAVTVGIGSSWLACVVLLLVAPETYLVATTLGGLAQGAGLTALFVLILQLSDSDIRAASYSAFMQGTGYVLSAVAPFAMGGLHQVTDGWRWPLALVLGCVLISSAAQLGAVRRSRTRPGAPAPQPAMR